MGESNLTQKPRQSQTVKSDDGWGPDSEVKKDVKNCWLFSPKFHWNLISHKITKVQSGKNACNRTAVDTWQCPKEWHFILQLMWRNDCFSLNLTWNSNSSLRPQCVLQPSVVYVPHSLISCILVLHSERLCCAWSGKRIFRSRIGNLPLFHWQCQSQNVLPGNTWNTCDIHICACRLEVIQLSLEKLCDYLTQMELISITFSDFRSHKNSLQPTTGVV